MREVTRRSGFRSVCGGVMPLGQHPRAGWGLGLLGHAAHLLLQRLLPLRFKPEPFKTRVLATWSHGGMNLSRKCGCRPGEAGRPHRGHAPRGTLSHAAPSPQTSLAPEGPGRGTGQAGWRRVGAFCAVNCVSGSSGSAGLVTWGLASPVVAGGGSTRPHRARQREQEGTAARPRSPCRGQGGGLRTSIPVPPGAGVQRGGRGRAHCGRAPCRAIGVKSREPRRGRSTR